ncbi:MAG: Vibrio phage VspSw 1 [Cyanobacteriota bacterium]|jgi:hypothetical protein
MSEIYHRIIQDGEYNQVRLVVNEFRGVEYLHLRKYYMNFDEEWAPSSEGISIPLDIENSRELFIGLTEILSLAESKEIIIQNFKDLLTEIYEK